jgi:hypothetical protein
MAAQDGLPSVEVFARNVTGSEGLGFLLLDMACLELGSGASHATIERRASGLLLEALCAVGIDPRTERFQRNRLSRLLAGDPLPQSDVQGAVDYILSQMVVQPKGALAECLAIGPCLEHVRELWSSERLPLSVEFKRGVWARRLVVDDHGGSGIAFAEWREGADGLFCATAGECEEQVKIDASSSSGRRPRKEDLLVFGVTEVKCYEHVTRAELLAQLDRHLARLAGGLQLRDPQRRSAEREYAPDHLWYAVPDSEGLRVLPVAAIPFRLAHPARAQGQRRVVWSVPMMERLIRIGIGPRPALGPAKTARRRRAIFDAFVPYDEEQLEEAGTAMAHYTLGAMADQPDLDLSGAEWSWNVEKALEGVGEDTLSARQAARRAKLLRRLR